MQKKLMQIEPLGRVISNSFLFLNVDKVVAYGKNYI